MAMQVRTNSNVFSSFEILEKDEQVFVCKQAVGGVEQAYLPCSKCEYDGNL